MAAKAIQAGNTIIQFDDGVYSAMEVHSNGTNWYRTL